jgi:uncharacterized protein (DUF2336 family)
MVEKAPNGDFTHLLDLAHDKSVASRSALVQTVSDLFFRQDQEINERERALMTAIMRQLIGDVEKSIRTSLAARLADEKSAPRELVRELADDEIEVALPILQRSTVLQDLDLIEIIRNRTFEHQLAIATRRNLSADVSAVLVETEREDVIRTLLENPDAAISAATMEYLVEQSRSVDSFQEPILRRSDLRPELAHRMYWWVSAALRIHILDRYTIDPAILDSHIEKATLDSTKQITETADGRAIALAEKLAASNAITPQLLVKTLRQGEIQLFLALFANLTGLRMALVRRITFEEGGEGMAIAARAIGLDKPSFASIFLLSRRARAETRAMDAGELARILALFDHLKVEATQRTMEYWKRDPRYLAALYETKPKRSGHGGK